MIPDAMSQSRYRACIVLGLQWLGWLSVWTAPAPIFFDRHLAIYALVKCADWTRLPSMHPWYGPGNMMSAVSDHVKS